MTKEPKNSIILVITMGHGGDGMKLENKIVREISACGGLSRRELEERACASASSVSRALAELLRLGLVAQTGKGENKRVVLGEGARLVSAFLGKDGFCLSSCLFDGSGREDREFRFCDEMFPEENISSAISEMGMYVRSLASRCELTFGTVLPREFHGIILSAGADAAFEKLELVERANSVHGGLGVYARIGEKTAHIFLLHDGCLINSPKESEAFSGAESIESLADSLGAKELFIDWDNETDGLEQMPSARAGVRNRACRVLAGSEGAEKMMLDILRDITVDKLLGRYNTRK